MSVFGPLSTNLGTVATASAAATGAIDARQTRFALVSTSGIYGVGSLTVGQQQSAIVIDNEKMLVQNVPLSGYVEVIRGVDGTKAKPHAGGATVWYAQKSAFGGLSADGFVVLLGTGGNPDGILPDYVIPLGTVRFENGKAYIMCDFTSTVHSGVCVGISNDGNFTAAPLTTSMQGAVGIVAEITSSSDAWGWVQVYGACLGQDASATSGITSAYIPIVAGSVSTPAAGMTALVNTTSTPQRWIYNMFITGDATTVVTSGASNTGVNLPLFLNFPYVFSAATDPGFS